MTKKISELPAASAVAGTDELEVNQSGTSRKMAVDLLLAATPDLTPQTFKEIQGDRQSYDLAGGAATLNGSKANVEVFGTAASSFALKMPNGTTLNEIITLISTGTYGDNVVSVTDNAGSPATFLSKIKTNTNYDLRWRGTGVSPRWNVAEISSRIDTSGVLTVVQNTTNIDLTVAGKLVQISGNVAINQAHPGETLFIMQNTSVDTNYTVSVGGTGTINGASSITINRSGIVAIYVVANPGTAPEIYVKGDTGEATTAYAAHDANDFDITNIGAGSTFETPASTLAALGGLPLAGGTMSGILKLTTTRGTARVLSSSDTIGVNDNGKVLAAPSGTDGGTATVAAASTLCPSAGDTFLCSVLCHNGGTYTIAGPGAGEVELVQNQAATVLAINAGAIRVFPGPVSTIVS